MTRAIRTPRLILRRARATDLADLHQVMRQPQAMRYWSTPEHDSIEETRLWLQSMLDADPATSDDYVVEHAGRAIGKAGAWRLPEIGYILDVRHWRQGLMAEALAALIPHLFAAHPIPALTAEVDPRNAASRALLARFGFRETHRAERTMKWRDEWCDSLYLALPRPARTDPAPPG
ncbi:MAG: GNAT family N-acetyltransferase [Rhodobacteraceae bacterium]|jgi:ribosomal-protein-alanine N-acetyltransferase|nr:GNAT family N-acetyltransferase [Paracoccaceae bacterium]